MGSFSCYDSYCPFHGNPSASLHVENMKKMRAKELYISDVRGKDLNELVRNAEVEGAKLFGVLTSQISVKPTSGSIIKDTNGNYVVAVWVSVIK